MPIPWSKEKSEYLMENWGLKSIPNLSRRLKVTNSAIINKVHRNGLGRFLDSGDYITINQFFIAIGRNGAWTYTLNQWIKKGFPMKMKKVRNCSFKVIDLNQFWKWAEKYRMHINFAKLKENVLGAEPIWVKDQRRADFEFSQFKTAPWTTKENLLFKDLLNLYKYTYKEISIQFNRTEGAIKRHIFELKLTSWPLREPPHSIWTKEQADIVVKIAKAIELQ